MKKKKITEEMQIQKEWYKEAKNQTPETIDSFVKKLMNDYNHDYGTICHALAAGAIGTMWGMNKSENGGITGFQAGAVMWEVIRNWQFENNKTGLKIVDFDNFLYPQYSDKFEKTISEHTWEALKKEAKLNLSKNSKAHPDVIKHWKKITEGIIPFGYKVSNDKHN